MSPSGNVVFDTYSHMADTYDARGNVDSCWGLDTDRIIDSIEIREEYATIADIGCGTGVALAPLAAAAQPWQQFIGVDPAEKMLQRAAELTEHLPNVTLREGAFENIPIESESVDYMFSINALHWAADIRRAMQEIVRVMKPTGEMDHFFIGRNIGREFVRVTTPIFLKHMGPKRLLEATRMRQIFTTDSAHALFAAEFGPDRVSVSESYDTYYDTVDGHLGWWVRIEPQLLAIPEERRAQCEQEVRDALGRLDEGRGVPYTKHTIRVRVRA